MRRLLGNNERKLAGLYAYRGLAQMGELRHGRVLISVAPSAVPLADKTCSHDVRIFALARSNGSSVLSVGRGPITPFPFLLVDSKKRAQLHILS